MAVNKKEIDRRIIVITGTPGVGKSKLASFLCKKFGFKRIDLHNLIEQNEPLSNDYNVNKDCYDLKISDLDKILKKIVAAKKSTEIFVLDSHISHLIDSNLVKLCIVIKCRDLKKLKRRLEERKYSVKKIEENLQCEIFENCLDEAIERKLPIAVIDGRGKEFNFLEIEALIGQKLFS